MAKDVKVHRRRDICFLIISIPFALMSIAAMTLPAFYEDIIDELIKQNLALEENTRQWGWFEELPVSLYFKIYIFDLENPDGVKIGDKPKLKEIGPYYFSQKRKKHSMEIIEDSVSYREDQFYEFDQEKSFPLTSADNFTSVNVVYMIISQIMENVPVPLPFDFEETLINVYGNADIIDTYNLGQVIFEGLYICNPETTSISGKLVCLMLTMLNLRFVTHFPDGSMRLSLFDYKNGTDAGVFNMNRGTSDIQKIGIINSWEGTTRTDYWKGDNNECDNFADTREGVFFSPKLIGQDFNLFSTDICRTVYLRFVSTDGEYEGVDAYKFELDRNIFTSNDPESCYCIEKTKGMDGEKYCFMDGLLDMHSCLGIPALLSLPHFLDADPKYGALVEGLAPDREKHGTFVKIEPLSGAPLEGARRVQFNFVIRPIVLEGGNELVGTTNVQRTVLPLAWAEESTGLEGELLDLIQTMTFWYAFFDIFKWLLSWILGAVFAAPSFWVMFEVYTTKRQVAVFKAVEMDV